MSSTPRPQRCNHSLPGTPLVGQQLGEHCPGSHPWRNQFTDRLRHESSDGSTYNSPAHKSLHSWQSYGTTLTEVCNNEECGTILRHMDLDKMDVDSDDSMEKRSATNRPAAWVWMIMTVTLFGSCLLCILQPYWIVSQAKDRAFGLLNFCQWNTHCKYYKVHYGNITVNETAWKLGLALYSVGCIQLGFSAGISAFNLCVTIQRHRNRMTLIGGYLQVFSVVFLMTAMVILPVGFGNAWIREACGDSDVFSLASCSLGWTYILSIVTALLTALLPVLSHYVE